MAVLVRYTYTFTARGVVDAPYRCVACRLTTIGHAQCEGVGSHTTVLFRPDEAAVQRDAQRDLQTKGTWLVDSSPCPRCGATSEALRDALAAYDAAYPGGRRGKRLTIFGVGFGVTATIALACVVSMIAFPTEGSSASDMVGAAVCAATFLLAVGSAISTVIAFIMGPAPRPAAAGSIPPGVWFDPPSS